MPHVATPQSRCRFGIATADVTPPVGIYHRMWGAATHDRSEGVHRPLTATALSFGELAGGADACHVLVALDLCLLGVDEIDLILKQAADLSGLPPEAITITFSHTHAAGLLLLDRQDLPGGELIPEYLRQVAKVVAGLVSKAVASACEADITYGSGRCDLAAHRDFFDAEQGEYVCGFNPDGDADDTVTVARVTNADGATLAAIVNYACHPTTLAWDNRLISPDFPGAMREVVSAAVGAPCVFVQGASGELGPVEGFVGDTAVADRNGRKLGYAALAAWESLPPANTNYQYAGRVLSGATIGTWQHSAIDQERSNELAVWACDRDTVELEYRDDLRRRSEVEADYAELLEKEESARAAGDSDAAASCRALAERQRRALGRLNGMVRDDVFPLQTVVWRMGDAIWIAVQGEPYSLLQRSLRERFPGIPIIVISNANAWGPSYLPPQELYGQGIYQEKVAWLAPASLEKLIDVLSDRLSRLLA